MLAVLSCSLIVDRFLCVYVCMLRVAKSFRRSAACGGGRGDAAQVIEYILEEAKKSLYLRIRRVSRILCRYGVRKELRPDDSNQTAAVQPDSRITTPERTLSLGFL